MSGKLGFDGTDDLSEFLCRGVCTMVYQPIFDLASERVYGFEALMRGVNGTVLPAPDIIFNRKGYLDEDTLLKLDISGIGSALRSGRGLARDFSLFINVRASSLRHLAMCPDILMELLGRLDIDPRHIIFEISERTEASLAASLEEDLREFVDAGISVAVDDIGFSFDWLRHMLKAKPVYLKVDKSYIFDIDISMRKRALVKSLNLMCLEMGLELIAEGIDQAEQVRTLNAIGIHFAQGFWFGRPAPAGGWVGQ